MAKFFDDRRWWPTPIWIRATPERFTGVGGTQEDSISLVGLFHRASEKEASAVNISGQEFRVFPTSPNEIKDFPAI